MPMKIEYAKRPAKGVTQLMYVGDAGDGLGLSPDMAKGMKIGAALVIGAVIYHLATRKKR